MLGVHYILGLLYVLSSELCNGAIFSRKMVKSFISEDFWINDDANFVESPQFVTRNGNLIQSVSYCTREDWCTCVCLLSNGVTVALTQQLVTGAITETRPGKKFAATLSELNPAYFQKLVRYNLHQPHLHVAWKELHHIFSMGLLRFGAAD